MFMGHPNISAVVSASLFSLTGGHIEGEEEGGLTLQFKRPGPCTSTHKGGFQKAESLLTAEQFLLLVSIIY